MGRGADEESRRSVSSPTFSYYPVVCVCVWRGWAERGGARGGVSEGARVRRTAAAAAAADGETETHIQPEK